MVQIKKLPAAEFEVMHWAWQLEPPFTRNMLLAAMEKSETSHRKPQTFHTLLNRLEDRGFLRSEKCGKERFFTPLVKKNTYLNFETQNFIAQYHDGSCLNLLDAVFGGGSLKAEEISQLVDWVKERERMP